MQGRNRRPILRWSDPSNSPNLPSGGRLADCRSSIHQPRHEMIDVVPPRIDADQGCRVYRETDLLKKFTTGSIDWVFAWIHESAGKRPEASIAGLDEKERSVMSDGKALSAAGWGPTQMRPRRTEKDRRHVWDFACRNHHSSACITAYDVRKPSVYVRRADTRCLNKNHTASAR